MATHPYEKIPEDEQEILDIEGMFAVGALVGALRVQREDGETPGLCFRFMNSDGHASPPIVLVLEDDAQYDDMVETFVAAVETVKEERARAS